MENERGGLPTAGWYADPHGVHELRYWDGAAWTDHVADGGVTSVEDRDAPETGSEPVLFTLHNATEVRMGGGGDPLVNVHITDRRLLFEYLTSRNAGAIAAGGLIGRSIGAIADTGQVEGTGSQAKTVDEVLSSSNEVRMVDFADVKKMLLRKKDGKGSVFTISSTRSTVNASKSVIVKFEREEFDEASELLADAMPGRVTVK